MLNPERQAIRSALLKAADAENRRRKRQVRAMRLLAVMLALMGLWIFT